MAEESTQRHTGESTKPPAAHHRASSQNDTNSSKKQPPSPPWLLTLERIIDVALDLAIRGTCVWGAIVGYLHTGNSLFFLLCLAVARKELGVFAAIQALLGSVGLLNQSKRTDPSQNDQPDPPATVS
jgi:hypothetical protein